MKSFMEKVINYVPELIINLARFFFLFVRLFAENNVINDKLAWINNLIELNWIWRLIMMNSVN